jgi:hypothetical protein
VNEPSDPDEPLFDLVRALARAAARRDHTAEKNQMTMGKSEIRNALDAIDPSGEPQRVYQDLLQLIGRFLDMVESERRTLTTWEKAYISHAIGAMGCFWLRLARVDIENALADEQEIDPESISSNVAAAVAPMTTGDLRDKVQFLAGASIPVYNVPQE